MSSEGKIWKRVSVENPCPMCHSTDWCQFGDRAMKCMRVESVKACTSGGWYHFYDRPNPDFLPKQRREVRAKKIDAFGLMQKFRANTKPHMFNCLAKDLGVTPESLMGLQCAWAGEYKAWAFPMKDGMDTTIGIRLRNAQGFKWAVTGSAQGIFIPNTEQQLIVYLPEGPTDTAACLSIGLFAIGRPNNICGAEMIKVAMHRLGIHKAVIVSDNDEMKRDKFSGREWRPGIVGALQLKKELGVQSVIWVPPSPLKDIREFVQKGGHKVIIESQIRNKVWSRK